MGEGESDLAGTVMSERPSAVRARGVCKAYPVGKVTVEALRGVDVDLPTGSFIVLLGPSGSGKTTLLNLMAAWTNQPRASWRSWASGSDS